MTSLLCSDILFRTHKCILGLNDDVDDHTDYRYRIQTECHNIPITVGRPGNFHSLTSGSHALIKQKAAYTKGFRSTNTNDHLGMRNLRTPMITVKKRLSL